MKLYTKDCIVGITFAVVSQGVVVTVDVLPQSGICASSDAILYVPGSTVWFSGRPVEPGRDEPFWRPPDRLNLSVCDSKMYSEMVQLRN